jgi:glycosyltransferase involved in cell wall biosynthesis
MRVLYVCRLFTGLENSIIKNEWGPTGVPTIYKILEELNKESDLRLFLVQKPGFSNKYYSKDFKVQWQEFNNPVFVISGEKYFKFSPKRIRLILSEIRHLFIFFRQVLLIKPDIIYFDNSNILTFGVISRIFKIPTIFRIMGVNPFMKKIFQSTNFKNLIFRFLYMSPFSLVICTQDGSGIEPWLKKAINKKTKIIKLINGVPKRSSENYVYNDNKQFKILFIGKLESQKGPVQFVEAAIQCIKYYSLNIKFQIIGDGSLRTQLVDRINSEGLQNSFKFYHKVKHSDIIEFLKDADIYVSLNAFGNLSNANLEAISQNKCIIIPKSQPKTGVDLIVDKLFPQNAIYRIDSQNDIKGLSRGIMLLYKDPILRENFENNLSAYTKNLLSWNERVNNEISILKYYDKKNK